MSNMNFDLTQVARSIRVMCVARQCTKWRSGRRTKRRARRRGRWRQRRGKKSRRRRGGGLAGHEGRGEEEKEKTN